MTLLAVFVAVTLLTLPGSALAVAFNARVLRVSPLGVVLRRAGGRTVRFSADQVTQVASGVSVSGDGQAPLAHVAGSIGTLQGLAPGVIVRVTATADAGGRARVSLGLPVAAGGSRHARGVVSSVFGGSFLLDTANGLELRLRGRVRGLRACDAATVVYHQHHLTLVADAVRDTGRASCAG